ncbi:MAG: hypothetical protein ACTSXZ_11625 [Alphaproteobacteria bacterium]
MAQDIALSGYSPGALGRVVELHARYYHDNWGFGLFFESKVATELAEFLGRYDEASDLFRVATRGDRIVAGLDAARHLYESSGFTLVEEHDDDQWGKTVSERKFVLDLR